MVSAWGLRDDEQAGGERERDKLLAAVKHQVFNLKEEIPLNEFVRLYEADYLPNLGTATPTAGIRREITGRCYHPRDSGPSDR